MTSVLITQCLQHDFVGLVPPHDPLPNRLHVGHTEALRLLGPDPAVGPLEQLMATIRALPREQVHVIHVRDWHDPADRHQRDHLESFGPHCIRDSRGAAFVFSRNEDRLRERCVDSTTLNDFEGTNLAAELETIREQQPDSPLRVGVVGVWTEAKVSFLLYDLKTRLGVDELATCSALTASASRAQHFNALSQLERILGVRCLDSVGHFVDWLVPGAAERLPPVPSRAGARPSITLDGGELAIRDRDLIAYLYRDSTNVELNPLSGGFSGASVFRVSSVDALGHQQAPSVAKLGPRESIAKERVAFERVEEVLGNAAPNVRGFVDFGGRAGIKYSFASMGLGHVRSLKRLFEEQADPSKIDNVLRTVFDDILGPLYSAARYERLPLLEHYQFSSAWAASVRTNVERVVGSQSREPQLEFPGGYVVGNVCRFYEDFLSKPASTGSDFHYVSFVHGDLNGANILIDGRENVWVIDFFHTAPGHVLKDFAKLENDILYIFTPIHSRAMLEEALLITRALRTVEDLRAPLPTTLRGLESPELLRAWSTITGLRSLAGKRCSDDRHPLQMSTALLRFAVHTLSFDESSPLQKEWALAAACGFADDIVRTAAAERQLRIDWLETSRIPKGKLGLTICPGRRDRGRDLEKDLELLAQEGVSHLLCLVMDRELAWAGVADLGTRAEAAGLVFRQAPIADQGVPGREDARQLVQWCDAVLLRGDRVVVHCMGGLGRTGTIAACLLTARGASVEEALETVRRARGPRAVETPEQEAFVHGFSSVSSHRTP